MLTPLVLIIVLGCLHAINIGLNAQRFKVFAQTDTPEGRLAFYRGSFIKSLLIYGGGSVIALLLMTGQDMTTPVQAVLTERLGEGGKNMLGLGLGVIFVILLVLSGFSAVALRKLEAGDRRRPLHAALLPRNGSERLWGLILSANAGIVEEAFFRLVLPGLLYGVSGNMVIAIGLSAVLFGLGHAYQGGIGIIITSLIGLYLSLVYAVSGALWVAIGVHFLVDAFSLWVMPAILGDDKSI